MSIYNEGFGTLYERIVRKEYLERLLYENTFENVLEIKCGFGIDSRIFSGKKVTLADDRLEYVKECKKMWEQDECNIVITDMELLPFKKNSFDFIWSSSVLDDRQKTKDYILKLKELTMKYLLLFASNDLHFTHAIKKIGKERDWLDIKTLPSFFKSCGFKILDCGNIDSPPWPSGFCIPGGKMKSDTRKIDSSNKLKKIAVLENILPSKVKIFTAHQVYVFAQKI